MLSSSSQLRSLASNLSVAHVVVSDREWGAVRVAIQLAKQQAKTSKVWIAVNEDLLRSLEIPPGVKVLPLPMRMDPSDSSMFGAPKRAISSANAARALKRAYFSLGWNLVHFHLPNAYLLSLLSSRKMNRVYTIHGRLFERRLFRLAEKRLAGFAIGSSPTTAISQNAVIYAPTNCDVTVIRNGVDVMRVVELSYSLPDTYISQLKNRGHPLLVFPASYTRRKGQDLLIDSMPEILKDYPDARALLIGDGPDEAFLRKLVAGRGSGRVDFERFTSNVYPYMRASDVVLSHLSLRWPFPSLVELEALALGKPVITRYTEEKKALYGGSVYYLRAEDPRSLTALVKQAMTDAGRAALAEERRKTAKAMSWESVSEEYKSFYFQRAEQGRLAP